jgi:hypothetical protein
VYKAFLLVRPFPSQLPLSLSLSLTHTTSLSLPPLSHTPLQHWKSFLWFG